MTNLSLSQGCNSWRLKSLIFFINFLTIFYDHGIDYDHGGEECYAICTRVIHIRSRIGLTLESSDAIESIATHASKPERNAALLNSLQSIHPSA